MIEDLADSVVIRQHPSRLQMITAVRHTDMFNSLRDTKCHFPAQRESNTHMQRNNAYNQSVKYKHNTYKHLIKETWKQYTCKYYQKIILWVYVAALVHFLDSLCPYINVFAQVSDSGFFCSQLVTFPLLQTEQRRCFCFEKPARDLSQHASDCSPFTSPPFLSSWRISILSFRWVKERIDWWMDRTTADVLWGCPCTDDLCCFEVRSRATKHHGREYGGTTEQV